MIKYVGLKNYNPFIKAILNSIAVQHIIYVFYCYI